MPQIDFPPDPVLNQTYTFNNRTWRWNGQAWVVVSGTLAPSPAVDYVINVNGITGTVGISAGTNVSITTSGKTLTINSSGGGGGSAVGTTGTIQYSDGAFNFSGNGAFLIDDVNYEMQIGVGRNADLRFFANSGITGASYINLLSNGTIRSISGDLNISGVNVKIPNLESVDGGDY